MSDYIDLELSSPWLNAAGTLGFAPAADGWNWPEMQGGFVTNPVSINPRSPAETRTALAYPGGCLLHTGLPNPGLKSVLKRCAERWARGSLPVWVHLLADGPDEVHRMALILEEVEGVAAVEVGIPPGAAGSQALAMLEAAVGELAVIASLPLTAVGEPWVKEITRLGVRGLCLSAPRGMLTGLDGKLVSGRLVGAGLFPQAMAALRLIHPLGLPVAVGSGVFTVEAGRALLAAGAAAVQIDTALWL